MFSLIFLLNKSILQKSVRKGWQAISKAFSVVKFAYVSFSLQNILNHLFYRNSKVAALAFTSEINDIGYYILRTIKTLKLHSDLKNNKLFSLDSCNGYTMGKFIKWPPSSHINTWQKEGEMRPASGHSGYNVNDVGILGVCVPSGLQNAPKSSLKSYISWHIQLVIRKYFAHTNEVSSLLLS